MRMSTLVLMVMMVMMVLPACKRPKTGAADTTSAAETSAPLFVYFASNAKASIDYNEATNLLQVTLAPNMVQWDAGVSSATTSELTIWEVSVAEFARLEQRPSLVRAGLSEKAALKQSEALTVTTTLSPDAPEEGYLVLLIGTQYTPAGFSPAGITAEKTAIAAIKIKTLKSSKNNVLNPIML